MQRTCDAHKAESHLLAKGDCVIAVCEHLRMNIISLPRSLKFEIASKCNDEEKTYFDYRLQIFTSYLRCTPLAIWCSSTTQFQSTIPGWIRSMICRERGISLEYEEVSSHLQNEKSVTETVIEVVHVGVKPKRVDPVAVGLTKALLFISKLNVCGRSHPLGFFSWSLFKQFNRYLYYL